MNYILINCSSDGDTYQLFNTRKEGEKAFRASRKERADDINQILLLRPETVGAPFGFGARGDIFGAKVILSFEADDFY